MNGKALVRLICIKSDRPKTDYVDNSGESLPVVTAIGGQSMESDVLYFGRRASEERRAAMKAAHPGVRQAHLDMAQRYDDLVTAIAAREERLGLNLPSVA